MSTHILRRPWTSDREPGIFWKPWPSGRRPFDFKKKPPYPPTPIPVRRRKNVTVAAAFNWQNGEIICADSEMTHAEALKYNQEKIDFTYNDKVSLTLAGAGDDDFIRMA